MFYKNEKVTTDTFDYIQKYDQSHVERKHKRLPSGKTRDQLWNKMEFDDAGKRRVYAPMDV